jgi:hypothetical protein
MGGKGGLNIWDLEEDEKSAFFYARIYFLATLFW